MLLTLTSLLFLQAAFSSAQNVTLSSDCSCGFQDPKSQEVFTESIILYFNETQSVDQHIFEVRNFRNKNQRGWSSIYRQGANPANVQFGNNATWQWQDDLNRTQPSMQMILDPRRFDHLSVGAELRSMRRDIQYGTFRSSMRSAQPWAGGSAVSMYMKYNSTQDVEIDLLNMNNASLARVMQTVNGEYPTYGLAVNYTDIENGTTPGFPPRSPWDFMELQFDWNETVVDFWINGNNSRHVEKGQRTIPTTPGTFYFGHWSTGDRNYMMGPPDNGSYGSVQWVRAFFNSSMMTAADHRRYDQRCSAADYCSVDDIQLRGSSEYSRAATVPYKYRPNDRGLRDVAGYIAAAFTFFGVAAVINAILRRGPWHKLKKIDIPGTKRHSTNALRASLRESMGANMAASFQRPMSLNHPAFTAMGSATASGFETPAPGYTSRGENLNPYPYPFAYSAQGDSGSMTPLPAYESGSGAVTPARSARIVNGRWTPGHSQKNSDTLRPKTIRMAPGGALLYPPQLDVPAMMITDPVKEEPEEELDPREHALLALSGGPDDRRGSASSRSNSPRDLAYRELTGEADEHYDAEEDRDEVRPLTPVRPISPWQFPRPPFEDDRRFGERRQMSFMDLDDKSPKRSASQRSYRSAKEWVSPIEVPEAPQDMSVGKIMHEKTGVPDALTGGATAEPTKEQLPQAPKVPQTQQRIDYLAGLVAASCVMVTLRHFALTFWPFVVEAQGVTQHFHADRAFSYILGPYVLTPLWIGPFFVTSCRFLAQRYLKTGKFEDIGNKMLLRAPRMLIPVFVFMTLTYFLLSLGLTGRLEWLPSVSFSVWPYVVPQSNFGVFLNQMVELAYIIPNSPPEVINNYCVGVLWTIPVQLQFSFVVLLATVLIKDIKKPWKRMSFYLFSIAMGWYGSSWSACHWLGLMLADVDITYDWRRKIQARPWVLYPTLIFATILTLATPLVLLFNSAFYFFSFMSWDNAIHPEVTTGRPIYETIPSIWYAYPEYFAPSFAHLSFSLGLQLIVELSVWAQKALSIKFVTFFHPHIMTLYLLHGFIFWSIGSFTAVSLSNLSLPYWAILLITGLVCYAILILVTIIITPLIEFATKGATKNIWRWATEEPVPHRRTTAPFNKELIMGRQPEEGEPDVNQARRPSNRTLA
ncbi:Putative glycoside hydrolase family 16, concanavalin A-like lectin/glucanase domain superfamily [Septoria linicola]|uniref:Glycoside hydrolase family 16, concanavalin A-like lectin/glucanase domain superfamily n=1 Tax=Septoria linicola TaxID=215465 RepID=A0A9Q9B1X6_9PEZI|nr:putative glycoside hydrolase family 16, concanavalin A-like lectin/glucanase domain superfamily [Septoria linicola]USW57413.1 Putative glycoside hydrolase family 16, concanavalin A-like lectin/glucanase domain superfamily [Septoria linicola]